LQHIILRQDGFIGRWGCETQLPQYCQKVIYSSVTKAISTPSRNGASAGGQMAKELCDLRFIHLRWTGMLGVDPITEVLNYPDILGRNTTGISSG
jgi:hypothetical protein